MFRQEWNDRVFAGWRESRKLWLDMGKDSNLFELFRGDSAVIPIRRLKRTNNSARKMMIVFFHANNGSALEASAHVEEAIFSQADKSNKERIELGLDALQVEVVFPEYPNYHHFDNNLKPTTWDMNDVCDSDIAHWCSSLSQFIAAQKKDYLVFIGHSIGTLFAGRAGIYLREPLNNIILLAPLTNLRDKALYSADFARGLLVRLFFTNDHNYFDLEVYLRELAGRKDVGSIRCICGDGDIFAMKAVLKLDKYCTETGIVDRTGHNGILGNIKIKTFIELLFNDCKETRRESDKLGGGVPRDDGDKKSVGANRDSGQREGGHDGEKSDY